MAQVRNVRPGYAVIHPNRDKMICKITRLIVVGILLASAGLVLLITIGGWSQLEGMQPFDFAWALVYVIVAVYVLRWAQGLLPIAAGLGILLLIVAVVSTFGLAGTSWTSRDHPGFAHPQSLFGGSGFGAGFLGTLTVLLIVVEFALIVIAMIGFAQGWNVETEVPEEEARRRGSKPIATGPETAAA